MKKIVYCLMIVAALLVTVVPLAACAEAEPYDIVIEIWNPYTNEVMARNTNTEYDNDLFDDTLKIKKGDEIRFVLVRRFWVDENGEQTPFEYHTHKNMQSLVSYSCYDGLERHFYDRESIASWLQVRKHTVYVEFNRYGDNKDYKRAQFRFDYEIVMID
mgnify:CR=1 FL=1